MDRTVADLNIAHFRKLLETETDSVKRETLQRLLAEEEAKLARRAKNQQIAAVSPSSSVVRDGLAKPANGSG